MGGDKRKRGDAGLSAYIPCTQSDDDGELSDTALAVKRIQQQLAARDEGDSSQEERGPPGKRKAREDSPLGDGKERGAVTGIKLREFAPGAKRSAGGFVVKGKDGKSRNLGQGLESLAARQDSDDEEVRKMPEAPEGSFKRRDLVSTTKMDDRGQPTAQLGVDGKVWSFVTGGDSEEEAPVAAKRKATDGPKSKKDKKEKKKEKKKKKKEKKKEKKKKKKKDKKKESSSDESGSSSSS